MLSNAGASISTISEKLATNTHSQVAIKALSKLSTMGWIPLVALSLLGGCASIEPEEGNRADAVPEEVSERMALILKEIERVNSPYSAEDGLLSYEIRMAATQADVPSDTYTEWLTGISDGIGLLIISPIGGPYSVGYALLGNMLLMPMSLSLYSYEKSVFDNITGAMIETSFTGAIHESLSRRLEKLPAGAIPQGLHAEVVINGYGLVQADSEISCLVASTDVTVSREGDTLVKTSVNISNFNRSRDMPPPQCARLIDFARDDSRLLRNSLNEYAAVISYEVVRILQAGEAL